MFAVFVHKYVIQTKKNTTNIYSMSIKCTKSNWVVILCESYNHTCKFLWIIPHTFGIFDCFFNLLVEHSSTVKMLLFVLLSTLGFLAFYVGRSSKEMPKNWRQLKSEILWQYLGMRGLIEDYYLRKYNRVGKS